MFEAGVKAEWVRVGSHELRRIYRSPSAHADCCSSFPQNFTKPTNLANILKQSTGLALLAIGETFVLLIGGIDLSVGSVASFASVTLGVLVADNPTLMPLAIIAAIAFGLFVGLVNGFLVTRMRLPAFIVTLGTLYTIQGINLVWTHGGPRGDFSDTFRWISEGYFGMIPVAGILLLVVTIIATIIDTRTTFGRLIHSVGGNEKTARMSGVNTSLIKILVYMISSFCRGVRRYLSYRVLVEARPGWRKVWKWMPSPRL